MSISQEVSCRTCGIEMTRPMRVAGNVINLSICKKSSPKKVIIELQKSYHRITRITRISTCRRQVKFDKFDKFDDDNFSFDKNCMISHIHFSGMKTLS